MLGESGGQQEVVVGVCVSEESSPGFEGRCQTLICFYDEAHIAGFGTADRISKA